MKRIWYVERFDSGEPVFRSNDGLQTFRPDILEKADQDYQEACRNESSITENKKQID